MVLGVQVHHIFGLLTFWIKSLFLPQQLVSQLLACCVESSRSLECVLKEQCSFHQFLKMYCSFWPRDAKSRCNGKDPDAGKDCGQEKRVTEDEMVGWHYPLNEHEFQKTLGDSEEQGSLVCCSSWSCETQNRLSNRSTKIALFKAVVRNFVNFKTKKGTDGSSHQKPWSSSLRL